MKKLSIVAAALAWLSLGYVGTLVGDAGLRRSVGPSTPSVWADGLPLALYTVVAGPIGLASTVLFYYTA